MNSAEIKALEKKYLMPTYKRFDLVLSQGQGCYVKDLEGKKYLDFTAGIGVNCLGWGDQAWITAITQQLTKLQHCSNLYYTEPMVKLAAALCEKTGFSKVFFSNSGAEANECAIKAARKYSFLKYGKDRHVILTLKNSFHGRTMATISATGQAHFHQDFFPFLEGFRYIEAEQVLELEQAVTADVCAIMIEPIQGEGGLIPLSTAYIQKISELCRKKDILLLVDEVQSGMGRTGQLLAIEAAKVKPDIVTLAKGLGGGLPIGATLFSEDCDHTLVAGDHGSTFGANPVVAAAALQVLERLDEAFLTEVREKGAYLEQALKTLPYVQKVSGRGLMRGVSFSAAIQVSNLIPKLIEKGLLCLTAQDKLRLLPPLIISKSEIDEGITILIETLNAYGERKI